MDSTSGRRVCGRCRRTLEGRVVFAIPTSEGNVIRCLKCVLRYAPMLRRSLLASIVVGTFLVALNQGDLLASGQWSGALYWKVPLTYLVPFLVTSWSALSHARQ